MEFVRVVALVAALMLVILVAGHESNMIALGQTVPPNRQYIPMASRALPPTNTPTPTVTPTPTLTAMPTIAPGPVPYVIDASVYTEQSGAFLYILGEVHNNAATSVSFTTLKADFFDASGAFYDTDTDYIYEPMAPGQKACFWFLSSPQAGWSSLKVKVASYSPASRAPVEYPVSEVIGRADTFGVFEIVGKVTNTGPARTASLGVYGTFYSANRKVVGCPATAISASELGAGQRASFKLRTHYTPASSVASYDVRTRG